MTTAPKLPPPEVDGADMASICGVTPQTIRVWMDKGMPGCSKPVRNALYVDLAKAIPWLRENIWQRMDLRAQKLQAEVNIIQMQEGVMAGALVPVSQIAAQWSEECSALRGRLLSMPTTLAPRIAGAALNEAQVQSLLKAAVHDALSALSGGAVDEEEDAIPEPVEVVMPRKRRKRSGN